MARARARARARRFSRLPNFAGGNAKVSKLSFNVGACEGIKPKKGDFQIDFIMDFALIKSLWVEIFLPV